MANILFIELNLCPSQGGVERSSWTISRYLKKCGYTTFFCFLGDDWDGIENDRKQFLNLNEFKTGCVLNQFEEFLKKKGANKEEIRKVLESSKPNVRIKYNGDLFFVKAYDTCTFNGIDHKNYCYVMKSPSKLDTPFFYANFESGEAADRNIKVTDWPITIRRVNKNDSVMIKDYEVQVRRLFIDWKMPMEYREKWPVIVNRDGEVIYVPRYQKNFSVNTSLNFYVK